MNHVPTTLKLNRWRPDLMNVYIKIYPTFFLSWTFIDHETHEQHSRRKALQHVNEIDVLWTLCRRRRSSQNCSVFRKVRNCWENIKSRLRNFMGWYCIKIARKNWKYLHLRFESCDKYFGQIIFFASTLWWRFI